MVVCGSVVGDFAFVFVSEVFKWLYDYQLFPADPGVLAAAQDCILALLLHVLQDGEWTEPLGED